MYRASEWHSTARTACVAAALAVTALLAISVSLDSAAASSPMGLAPTSTRAASLAGSAAGGSVPGVGNPKPVASRSASIQADRPHVLDGAIADAIVRFRGGHCTGTPISGTVYVVTAAHCVLTETGEVTRRTIIRGSSTYTAVAVLVDSDYHDHPTSRLDAAVLIMDQVIPGAAARVGTGLPHGGSVTLAGFQPVDENGMLMRDAASIDAQSTRVDLPAGCVDTAASLDVTDARVMVPCGLVPGSSGGGLFTETNGELVLVGIVSTVTADLTANGVVPLAALRELLDHQDRYSNDFSTAQVHREHP
jgi:hypothetical protein